MDTTQVTYDICRCYLVDQKGTMAEEIRLKLLGYLRSRSFDLLASCSDSADPDVTGEATWKSLLQVEAFFKKNVCFAEPVTTKLAAFISFLEADATCEETNQRLDNFSLGEDYPHFKQEVEKMQRYISTALGDHADFLKQLPKLIRVTPGATASRPRRSATPFLKISKKVTCSPGAFKYLNALSYHFGYGELVPRLRSSNRVEFVPKSWKTDRTIACEPEGNMFLQLAFDKYAKRCLSRKGINLSDQTVNQVLAREGSINGNLSTIDLSQASDTVSYNTVALLFPYEWFQYLRNIRSSTALCQSYKLEYAKFSSMGNGATFSLETLIFAAACKAVGSKRFSVYGDDIIIETEFAMSLLHLLAFLGFIPNESKTFLHGPFRESCGAHWFRGVNVTPKYIRQCDSRKATMCHLVNTMMTISKPWGSLWDLLVSIIETEDLPLVPFNEDSMSGVWIHPSHAYAKKLIRSNNRTMTPKMRAYQPANWKFKNWDSRSLFLWHLGALVGRTVARVVFDKHKGINFYFEFEEPCESSRYTTSSHKYVRRWVHWKPVVGAPDHLYWWSDNLIQSQTNDS